MYSNCILKACSFSCGLTIHRTIENGVASGKNDWSIFKEALQGTSRAYKGLLPCILRRLDKTADLARPLFPVHCCCRLDLDCPGGAAVSPPLMQTQQGPLTCLSYADHMPGAVATGCQDGTMAIWNTQVRATCWFHPIFICMSAAASPSHASRARFATGLGKIASHKDRKSTMHYKIDRVH